jgi:hypothetical protein
MNENLKIWRLQILIVFVSALLFPIGIVILTLLRYLKFVEASFVLIILSSMFAILIINNNDYLGAIIYVNFLCAVFIFGFLSPENREFDSKRFRQAYIAVIRSISLSVVIFFCIFTATQISEDRQEISIGLGKISSVHLDNEQAKIMVALLVSWLVLLFITYMRCRFVTLGDVIKERLER